MEIACAIPLLLYLTVTYLSGTLLSWMVHAFPGLAVRRAARQAERGDHPADVEKGPYQVPDRGPARIRGVQPRCRLAYIARWPIRVLRAGLAPGNTAPWHLSPIQVRSVPGEARNAGWAWLPIRRPAEAWINHRQVALSEQE
jgi:hypothetical protein